MVSTHFNQWLDIAVRQLAQLILWVLLVAIRTGVFCFSTVLCLSFALVMNFDDYFFDSKLRPMDKR